VVIGGVAGPIAVVVGTVHKLTTVGAASYGSPDGSPRYQDILSVLGLAFAPDALGLG
jgi:hypothetical protein